jgi:hypothetical protein
MDNTMGVSTWLAGRYPEEYLATFNSAEWLKSDEIVMGLGYTRLPAAKLTLIAALTEDHGVWVRLSAARTLRPARCRPAQAVVVVGLCKQADGHAVVAHVDVRALVVDARQLADRLHEPSGGRERVGPEVRARTVADHAPILDAIRLVELPRRDPFIHPANLTL